MIPILVVIGPAILFTRRIVSRNAQIRALGWASLAVHTAASLAFSSFTASAVRGVDAQKFFVRGGRFDFTSIEGYFQADFVFFISAQLQRALPVTYQSFNLLAALWFSHVGFLLVARRVHQADPRAKMLLWVVVLLPAYNFWTSAFGKEALQVLFVGIYFSTARLAPKVVGMLGLLLVRPHIAIVLALVEGISSVISGRITRRSITSLVLGSFVVVVSISYLIDRLDAASAVDAWRTLTEFSDERSDTLRNSDTSSLLAPIEFLLRPYPWEVATWSQAVSSVDSIVTAIVICGVSWFGYQRFGRRPAWLFLVATLVLLSLTNPNVGTALRKKQTLVFTAAVVMTEPLGQTTRKSLVEDQELTQSPMRSRGG